jgi:hypothetical protein
VLTSVFVLTMVIKEVEKVRRFLAN